MVDIFTNEQSQRLFGFIAAGGTIGGIAGSALTSILAEHAGRGVLLLLSAVMLEVAVFSVRGIARNNVAMRERKAAGTRELPVGGGIFSGIANAIRSPYLMNISIFMMLFTILSTFLYFQQADIAKTSFTNRGARTYSDPRPVCVAASLMYCTSLG